MKHIILALMGILIGIYVLLTAFSVFSYGNRKNMLETRVSRIVQNTLEAEYQKGEEEQVREKLIEELSVDTGSNGRIEVTVRELDLEKGIISVRVTETFRQFNGTDKELVCEKTAIVERILPQEQTVTVTFLLDGEFYKEYQLAAGEKCPLPKSPGSGFKGWVQQGSSSKDYWKAKDSIWEDRVYVAIME